MTAPLLLALVAALFLVVHLLVRPALLWVAARLVKVARVSFGRCVLTMVVIVAIECVCFALLGFIFPELSQPNGTTAEGVLNALEFALWAGLSFVWVGWGLHTRWPATLRVLIVWNLLSVGVLVGVALGVRSQWLITFHVPTGNMAPAVLGAHLSLPCASCGFEIDASLHLSEDDEYMNVDRLLGGKATCANCGFSQSYTEASLREGDRILVDRTATPRRWDMMAFAYPRDPGIVYIKRLVGLPGETIEMFAGDIYANGRRVVKHPGTAEDTWILVHDTRFLSSRPKEVEAAWECRPESLRSTRQGPGWRVTDAESESEARLEFTRRITSHLPYNSHLWNRPPAAENVTDVVVELAVSAFSGAGHLSVEWKRGPYEAQARFTAEDVTLESGEKSVSAELVSPLAGGGLLRFGVRDGQAFVVQEGALLATLVVFPAELEAFKRAAPPEWERCRLALSASRCDLHVSWISIKRDVHYIDSEWAGCVGCPGKPIALFDDEYYVLGDNVESSNDSRFWGTVPARLVIGRLIAIFWPVERWRFFDE